MTGHAAPFTAWRTLPLDVAVGAWLVYGALLVVAWDAARPLVIAAGRRAAELLPPLPSRSGAR